MVKPRKGKGRAEPSPMPIENTTRTITVFCWFLDVSSDHSFSVKIEDSRTVDDLKAAILEKKSHTFAGVEVDQLTLRKVSIAIDNDLKTNVTDPEVLGRAELLEADPLSDIFPHPEPAPKTLHIVVQLLPGDQHLSKRQRIASFQVPEEIQQFWKRLWIDRLDPIQEVGVHRDPDHVDHVDVPTIMKVLSGLPKLFSSFDVLIRDEYNKGLPILQNFRTTRRAVIIIGHPGIGKTLFLYYLLVLRLLKQQPTIFQYRSDMILLFDTGGVSAFSPHSEVESSDLENTWALVDSNNSVETPADTLVKEASPFFLVVACYPQSFRWAKVEHYRPPVAYWFMQPFTLEELIQARQLQRYDPTESDIQDFFEMCGPSARDCFAYCSERDKFYGVIRNKVAQMGWDTLTTALTAGVQELKLEDGSHKVILVTPRPEDSSLPRMKIITKAVYQLLWDQDSLERGRHYRRLYRTLRLEPSAKGFTGTLFEPPFHELCVKGATLTLYPMTLKSEGSVNYIFVNCPITTQERLVLPQQTRVVFNRTNPITSLLANHYYQPTVGNQPSYDSFIYDPSLSRMTTFQVTDGENHSLKPKGVHALRDLAKKLHVDDLKLRFVIVGPEGSQVTCPVEKQMYEDLGLEMCYLEVTENQLYD